MDAPRVVASPGSPLRAALSALAAGPRMVFFAGLPGTGKSLMGHQLAHLAHATGRAVHLLRWDTARPVFEASPAGRRYPVVAGVTQPVIRKAVGRWARGAVARWHARYPKPEHLLIGETPFVGHRLVELARRHDDAAEHLLAATSTRFVIPVPSRDVRRFLEAERQRRATRPLHDQEREDAPPAVLRDMWRELVRAGAVLGLSSATTRDAAVPYDPQLYERIYRHLLRHRHVEVLHLDTVLPTETFSVYDLAVPSRDVHPTAAEVRSAIRAVERRYPDGEALASEIERWYEVQ